MRLKRVGWVVAAACAVGAAFSGSAWAATSSSFTVPTDCEIDLAQNGLGGFVSATQVPGGVVFTSNATKKCTNSASRQVILLSCKTRIPTWSGGTRSKKNVRCVIRGEECGVDGTFTVTKATLTVASNGTANLSCNLSRNLP